MRKIWDIHGGVHPPENKTQSVHAPIQDLPLPSELVIPVGQHIGAPARPVVSVGQSVLKGDVIAEAQGIFSANIHASTSGTVCAIEPRVVAHPSGLTALCIVIKPDGEDRWCALSECEDYEGLDHFELVARIQKAGLAGMGGAGFPTAVKLNPKSVDKIETLILNGTECEPYITADDLLMRECAEDIVAGMQLLAKIVGHPKTLLIGIEDNKPEAIAAMQKACEGSPVEVVVFPTKYPSGGEKQLIQILTGRELPSGKLPAQIGVLVQNVGTAYAAWRAVRYGEPLIERVTTVVGQSLQQQNNVRTRIGTPIAHLLACNGFNAQDAARIIIGGPMMGYAITDLRVPVVKTTNCVLAPSHAEMPPPPPAQACIRCGLCAEACPVQLLPQQLYWYAKADDTDRLKSHHLMDCIECGACSFVCPSAIPLVQYYRAAKGSIRRQEADKLKSDRARERFDQRKARLAKAEAEKEAKRLARKKAAEAAKLKLAQANGNPDPTTESENTQPSSDLAALAMAKAKAKTTATNPEAQRKKLARALSSAQSRLERATKQLAESPSDQQEKWAAALKQAELKVAEATEKLSTFEAQQTAGPVMDKLSASPAASAKKAVTSLEQRLQTAKQKLQQAESENAPTVAALRQGVEKLETKFKLAQTELSTVVADPSSHQQTPVAPEIQDAAALAIAKAKAKAQARAHMTEAEQLSAQRESLIARIEKAEQRLAKAQTENSEHCETLAASLKKLQDKLTALES